MSQNLNACSLFSHFPCIDPFMNYMYENFDKMQMIFKAITGTTGYASWWEITVCHSMETVILFDAGLVALESTCISPGKGIHHSTLRCHTLPSGENFSRQRPAPWFYDRFFSLVQCHIFFPTKGCDRKFRLSL